MLSDKNKSVCISKPLSDIIKKKLAFYQLTYIHTYVFIMMSIFQCTNAIFNWSPQIALGGKMFFETLLILYMLYEVNYIILFTLYLIFFKSHIIFILALYVILLIHLCTFYLFSRKYEKVSLEML